MSVQPAVAAVKRAFETGDITAIAALCAEDIELRPPTYGKSWHGRDLVVPLLGFAAASFDSLVYTDEIADGATIVMRFEAKVGEDALSGVDLARLDAEGRIAIFEIFSRPPKVALAFLDRMTACVAAAPDIAAMMHRPNGGA